MQKSHSKTQFSRFSQITLIPHYPLESDLHLNVSSRFGVKVQMESEQALWVGINLLKSREPTISLPSHKSDGLWNFYHQIPSPMAESYPQLFRNSKYILVDTVYLETSKYIWSLQELENRTQACGSVQVGACSQNHEYENSLNVELDLVILWTFSIEFSLDLHTPQPPSPSTCQLFFTCDDLKLTNPFSWKSAYVNKYNVNYMLIQY